MKKNFNVERCALLHKALEYTLKTRPEYCITVTPAYFVEGIYGSVHLTRGMNTVLDVNIMDDIVPDNVVDLINAAVDCYDALVEEYKELRDYAQERVLSAEDACRLVELEEELEQELEELDTDHYGWYY